MPPRGSQRLLLVDDDLDFRAALAERMRELSLVVDEAGDYEEAMRRAAAVRPARAVVDLRLPGDRNGLHVIRDLRALHPDTPCLLMTAYPSAMLMYTCMRLGAVRCLAKTQDVAHILHAFAAARRPVLEPPAVTYEFPTLEQAQWEHIHLAMHLARGNVSHAAKLLGIRRQSLQRMLKRAPRLPDLE